MKISQQLLQQKEQLTATIITAISGQIDCIQKISILEEKEFTGYIELSHSLIFNTLNEEANEIIAAISIDGESVKIVVPTYDNEYYVHINQVSDENLIYILDELEEIESITDVEVN